MQEKKFNNAIEKAENLADARDTGNIRDEAEERTAKSRVKASTKGGDKKKAKAKGKVSNDKAKARKSALAAKQKREEERAKIRMQKAEEKAARKAERKAVSEAKKQEAARKREALKELRIKKKEERLARRDMLKHESKEERRERKFAEKQARIELKKERRERKAEAEAERRRLKSEALNEKRRLKAEAKERRMEAKAKRAEAKNARKVARGNRGVGGWLAAVIALGCSCLVLATLLVWNVYMNGNGVDMLAGTYARSFYDLVGYVDNIDVNLGKMGVSSDSGNRQKILSDIVLQASLAEGDLETLPLEDESRFYTIKFVNQLSDFGKYLNNKLIDGDTLSESDLNTLAEFKKINASLKKELNDLALTLGDGFDFNTLLTGEEENVVLKKFNELQSNAVEYPKMIYDGPFADEPEKSSGDIKKTEHPIDENQAKDLFIHYLDEFELKDVSVEGMADGQYFRSYRLQAKCGDDMIDGQISDEGKLVTFNYYKDCKEKNFDRDQCIEIAASYLEKCGYKSIKPVWTTENGNTVYVNFVERAKDDIIIYADMIKVEVCMERGKVTAMDAVKYLENHKERNIPAPAITVSEAENKLSKELNVETSRLAYIPLESGIEKLAYEFYGKTSDGEYYVYVDAVSGRELQIFKVVETEEGTLLL